MQIPSHLEDFITGALGGTASDLFIDIPLSHMGAFYTVNIKTAGGAWIWGFGTGEVINGIFGLLAWMGYFEDTLGISSEVGLGWLMGLAIAKISELYEPLEQYVAPAAGKWDIII